MAKKKKSENTQSIVTSFYISRGRNKKLFNFLDECAKISIRLYNQCIYYAKTYRDHEDFLPSAEAVSTVMRMTEAPYDFYSQMQLLASDDFAAKTVLLHYTVIQSFIGLLKSENNNSIPSIPRYKDISTNSKRSFATRVRFSGGKEDKLERFFENKIKNGHDNYRLYILKKKKIWIPVPRNVMTEKFKNCVAKEMQINFIPISHEKYKIQFVYDVQKSDRKLNYDRILSIDLGKKNFATCISNDPNLRPFILNGKEIVSINNLIQNKNNGKIAKMQHKIDILKDEKKISEDIPFETKLIKSLRLKRERYIHDIFHQYSKYIIKYCIENNIGTIVVGQNKGWKENTKKNKGADGNRKFGKNQTREFHYIPYYKFEFILEYKAKLENIKFERIEESYTSQVDHLSEESIEFHPSSHIEGMGRNLYIKKNGVEQKIRGLYKSKYQYVIINADVNGAMGIMRKYLQKNGSDYNFRDHVVKKIIFNPIRIKYNAIKEVSTISL